MKSIQGSRQGICAIVSKNHLSYARNMVGSYKKHHRGRPAFVLVYDLSQDELSQYNENFFLIAGDGLAREFPEFYELAFKYSNFELACALKPYFLLYLFKKHGLKSLFYVDADIQFYSSIDRLHSRLSSQSVLLVPHSVTAATTPPDDSTAYSDMLLLLTGSYNAGFFGVRATKDGIDLLNWWRERLSKDCAINPSKGLFHDQRWLDLVPAAFEGVYIERGMEFNVAFWNLHDRKISDKNGRYYCGERPLAFFHFSHVNLLDPKDVGPAWTLRNATPNRPVLSLIKDYRLGLIAHGYEETSKLAYGFARFDNGALIPIEARRLFQKASLKKRFGNPFSTRSPNSFYQWMLKKSANKPSPLEAELVSSKAKRSALDPKIRADLLRASKSR